ncbi:MAG: glycosyltransferase family 4 protein [Anaerolineales bacterium]|nr:glycosyltransferase family 4 protein [Anaerolineales bacterium]
MQPTNNNTHNIVYMIDGLGWGGAERLMIPILSNINKKKFNVRVCVLQNKDGNPVANELREIGINVDMLSVRHLRDLTAIPRIKSYLQRVKTDLLHAQLEFATVLGGLAAKSLHIPSVVTLHTIPENEEGLKSNIHLILENFILRNFIDRVVSVSEETQRFYLRTAKLSNKKSCVIYNGIDVNKYSVNASDHSQVLKEFDIPPTAVVLTTVAVLREPKGIQYMIQAMPALVNANPQIYYLIVGGGEYFESLQNEVKNLGVDKNVRFAGARKDIPSILSASDLFVLPTLTEALPTVLAEAMAANLPIVASRVGGVPEMIQDGINGKLIEPANPEILAAVCLEMLNDRQSLRQMGIAGGKIAEEKFNIKSQVQQLQDLYNQLMLQKTY